MTTNYEYLQNSQEILTGKATLNVFDFASGKVSEDTITYQNSLLFAIHGAGNAFHLARIPANQSPTQNEIDQYKSWIRESFRLQTKSLGGKGEKDWMFPIIASSSRTHGNYFCNLGTRPNLGRIYFGSAFHACNYGSNLVSNCRLIQSLGLNYIFIEDESFETMQKELLVEDNTAYPGDSFGLCSESVAKLLTGGATRRKGLPEWDETTLHPIQARILFENRMVWKGTLAASKNLPAVRIRDKLGQTLGFYADYDCILPRSGIKGNNKPKDKEVFRGR